MARVSLVSGHHTLTVDWIVRIQGLMPQDYVGENFSAYQKVDDSLMGMNIHTLDSIQDCDSKAQCGVGNYTSASF